MIEKIIVVPGWCPSISLCINLLDEALANRKYGCSQYHAQKST